MELKNYSPVKAKGDSDAKASELLPRENEVAQLIALGLESKDISKKLEITLSTVKNHIASIFNKLGLNKRAEIAVWYNKKYKEENANHVKKSILYL